jgi:hypothetical protein
MKKRFLSALAFLAVVLFGVDAIAGNISTEFDAKIGGYVKLDYIRQTFHTDIPQFATLSTVTPANEDDDQSQFTARQSRLNLIVTGPEYLGAKTRAFVEGDFFGPGGTNDRGNFRLRHANFTLDWEEQGTQLMFGQFWDIFGPFAASTLEFGTGANIGGANNPRIAQARVTRKIKFNEENWLTVIAGLQDPQQDDEEGPTNVAAQVMFQTKALGASPGYWGLPMQPLTLNVFGLFGEDDTTGAADGADASESFDSWGAGFYTHVPILKSSDGKSRAGTLTFEGQAYIAEGLTHVNATQYSFLADATGDVDAAKGYGAVGQLIFYPTQPLGITAGYGRRGIRDTKEYREAASLEAAARPFGTLGDPAGTIRSYNDAYWANVTYDVSNVRFGIEYMHLETHYIGSDAEPEGDRFQFSAIYFF